MQQLKSGNCFGIIHPITRKGRNRVFLFFNLHNLFYLIGHIMRIPNNIPNSIPNGTELTLRFSEEVAERA